MISKTSKERKKSNLKGIFSEEAYLKIQHRIGRHIDIQSLVEHIFTALAVVVYSPAKAACSIDENSRKQNERLKAQTEDILCNYNAVDRVVVYNSVTL